MSDTQPLLSMIVAVPILQAQASPRCSQTHPHYKPLHLAKAPGPLSSYCAALVCPWDQASAWGHPRSQARALTGAQQQAGY